MKKLLALVLAALLCCTLAFAVAEDAKTITVWAWDDAFNIAAMKTAAEMYQAKNPDVKVEFDIVSNSKEDVYKKLQTGLASGGKNLPDICLVEDTAIYQYINAYGKYFFPLNDYIDYTQFAPYKVAVMTYDGVSYGIPFDAGTVATFYRNDLIEAAGFTSADMMDITWDRFIEIGQAVEKATGVKMTVANGTNYSSFFRTMMQSAGSWYCDAEGNITIKENAVLREALETIKRMRDAGIINECADDSTMAGAINDGTTATVVNAAWRVSTIKAEESHKGLWRIANCPRLVAAEGATNYSNTGGSSWYTLNNGKDNKELVTDFLATMFCGDVDFYDSILVNQGVLATYIPAQQSAAYTTADEFFGGQELFADLAAYTAKIPGVNYGYFVSEANTAVNTALYNYLQGSIDVDTALEQAEDQVRNRLGLY